MEGERDDANDLRVQLNWPGDDEREMAGLGRADAADGLPQSGQVTEISGRTATGAIGPTETVGASERPSAAAPSDEASGLIGRFEQLTAEISDTKARVDTLANTVVTFQGLVSDRLGQVTEAINQSRTLLTQEISSSARPTALDSGSDGTPVGEQANVALARSLDESIERSMASMKQVVAKALERADDQVLAVLQEQVVGPLERSFAHALGRVTRQTEEALTDTRAQLVAESESINAASVERLAVRLDQLSELQRTAQTRSGDDGHRRHSETTSQLEAILDAQRDVMGRLDRVAGALSSEVATVGEAVAERVATLSEWVTGSADSSSSDQVQTRSELVVMRNSVTGALEEVASRLESVVIDRSDTNDLFETMSDSIDELSASVDDQERASRSRHDRLTTILSELRSAARPAPVDLRPVMSGLESLEATVERVEAEVVQHRDSTGSDTTIVSALDRIEGILGDLRDQQLSEPEGPSAANDVNESLHRLAQGRAEDLEKILDAVERQGSGATNSPAAGSAIPVDAQLRPVVEQLEGLQTQVEALRRRLAVRGRAPVLDDASIATLADALAARLGSAPQGASEGGRPAPSPRRKRPSTS